MRDSVHNGFTLLELVIIIVILGVLATLGTAQYQKMIERGRGTEARNILGLIRTQAAGHRLQYGSLDGSTGRPVFSNTYAGIGNEEEQNPSVCRPTHYFSYNVNSVTSANSFLATATRCTSGGKTPNASAAVNLTLTTNFSNGQDTWGGSGGY